MPRIEKTVFISYRRTNKPWALFIYQNLTMHGYDVFIDFQNINSGNFETAILDNIRTRVHFIVILTPSALERCKESGDWLRREIETAIDEKRNIVPLMVEGFDFGSPLIKETLTGRIAALSDINGLRIPDDYPLEAMDRLRERFLNISLSDVHLPTLREETKEIATAEKSAANQAAPVSDEELTAQTWFEKGYVFQEAKNLEEAQRCYGEAIHLDPQLDAAYNNLGALLNDLKRYDEAEAAYRKAIELNPSYATAYYNLGSLLDDLKRYDEAEAAYRKAIELNPSDATAYSNLGILLKTLERYDEAEAAYRKAIELNPSYATAYSNLGLLLHLNLERYTDAEEAYRKALEIIPSLSSANYLLGILLRDHLKQFEESEGLLLKAIEFDSSNTYYYDGLVRLYRFNMKGRLKDVVPLLEKMIELNPENFDPYLAIASICRELGNGILSEPIEKARQFMSEDDFYNRACLESVSDNFDMAFEHLLRAAQKEKFNPAWAWEDPDLQWIRDDPMFVEIVGPKPENKNSEV